MGEFHFPISCIVDEERVRRHAQARVTREKEEKKEKEEEEVVWAFSLDSDTVCTQLIKCIIMMTIHFMICLICL